MEPILRNAVRKPDPALRVAGFRRWAEWGRAQEAKTHDSGIPDPLGIVIALLDLPNAPKDWVPTEVLAVAAQRVAVDASPEEKQRAAEQFGRELTAQDSMLASVKEQKWVGRRRMRGYPVPALRAAAERARRASRG